MTKIVVAEKQCVDGYLIQELVGEGGFSKVYRVTPQGLDNQSYALKHITDSRYYPLLLAEAEILSKLDHSQIPKPIRVGDCIIDCHSGKYLLMTYVPDNLQNLLSRSGSGVLGIEQAIVLIKQLLQILIYTHAKGVIHKDLKPKNIGLDHNGNVLLLDFNIAKTLAASVSDSGDLQHSSLDSDIIKIGDLQKSLLGGTEGYRSPEQRKLKINSKIHDVDARSDLYTVGILFYEMLIGYLPDGAYVKPSIVDSSIPVWVNYFIDKALAPNPKDRFLSATEMLQSLDNAINNVIVPIPIKDKFLNQLSACYSVLSKIGSIVKKNFKAVIWFLSLKTWNYPFVTSNYEDRAGLQAITTIAALVIWILLLIFPIIPYLAYKDEKFLSEFKNAKKGGCLVFSDSTNIWYVNAKHITDITKYSQLITPYFKISNLVYLDKGVVFFTAYLPQQTHCNLYQANLLTGEIKLLYSNERINALKLGLKSSQLYALVEKKGHGIFWIVLDLVTGVTSQMSLLIPVKSEDGLSPDGKFRVLPSGTKLKIEYADEWGGLKLPTESNGLTWALWTPDEFVGQ